MLTLIMAKAQLIARFATEIAPSQLSSIVRRRRALPRRLDTIAEEEKEAAVELSSYALLHAKARRQNLSRTKEAGKSTVNGEKQSVAGDSSAHGKKPAVVS
ncbi:hypothetical protein ACP70R_010933 [Stipagrostis hirtigluma subsp. patula]